MARDLTVSIGQYSGKGRKEINQDFHGALIPAAPLLGLKGIAIALADGIGSSKVSQIASESAVAGFLSDYYCTPDSWPVKTSAQRVIAAANSWLHAQTRRSPHPHDKDKGYVCTLSVLILKSATAHLFHAGDSRIHRLSGRSLEPLTIDHRVVISSEQTYLSRALGMNEQIEIDYRAIPLEKGDIFVLTTDGVHDHVSPAQIADAIDRGAADLDAAAAEIAARAFQDGSPDNLTVQIVRIDELPVLDADEALGLATDLPPPPLLEPRALFDGYRIVRPLHDGHRSHIYLAVDIETGDMVALKIPSIELRGDTAYLKRFMMEEWVASRIGSPHVLKPRPPGRRRNFLYTAMEYVEGQTLAQWMRDHPEPDLESVRSIAEQIARGLRAFHRMEMLHQDLRPENILIDRTGTVKLIDFGSVAVSGVIEASPQSSDGQILGTVQYTAPEYFLGQPGSPRSDLYSLGTIAYQMLTGQLPYGARMARARSRAAQRKIAYTPAAGAHRNLPAWIDPVLRKAVHPDPSRRQEALSEFVHDLRHPGPDMASGGFVPLIERNPLLFWKGLSFVLACLVLFLAVTRH